MDHSLGDHNHEPNTLNPDRLSQERGAPIAGVQRRRGHVQEKQVRWGGADSGEGGGRGESAQAAAATRRAELWNVEGAAPQLVSSAPKY